MNKRRTPDVPLMGIQTTENFPQIEYLGSTVNFQKKMWFSRLTPNTTPFIKYFNIVLHKSSSKTHTPPLSYGFTFLLKLYWVPQASSLKILPLLPFLDFSVEGTVLLKATWFGMSVKFAGQFLEKRNGFQTLTGLLNSLQPPHPCCVFWNSCGYHSSYHGVFMKTYSGNLPRFWKKEKLFWAEHLVNVLMGGGACES